MAAVPASSAGVGHGEDARLLASWADTARPRPQREAAFRHLVRRHQAHVHAVCLRELRSRTDAEDAVQDVFAKAARAAAGFRGDSRVSTWLHRIAINTCRDVQRRRARRPVVAMAVDESLTRGGHATDPAGDHAETTSQLALITQALAGLDPLSRTLILLCSVGGHSYAEAAVILDVPVGTIKSRIHRARARLAETLANSDASHVVGVPHSRRAGHVAWPRAA